MSIYLYNAWYAAGFSEELAEKPVARTLLDEEIVLFRKADGSPAMLEDRCPHRFAPLSRGRVVGNHLECGYHGLRFDATGACAANPHAKAGAPGYRATIRSYPVIERHGLIWFWPGDPSLADPGKLIELSFMMQPERFSVVKGYLHVAGNYQLIADNLLDLSHAVYLHPEFAIRSASQEATLAATESRLERRERSIFNYRLRTGLEANQQTKALFGFPDGPAITKSHMTWHPPGLLDFDLGTWAPGTAEEDGVLLPQAHITTPETEFTTHYFFVNGRNRRLRDPVVDQALRDMFDTAFRGQDEPMIEAVQRKMGRISDIQKLNPVLLATDGAPVAARRLLARLIEQERTDAAAPAAE